MWKRQTRDWEQRKFGDIAQSFEYGLNAPAKEYDGTNKYLRITDIDDVSRKFNTDNLTSPDIELSTAKNYRLLNGDILFARTGASVGKSFIYRDSDGIVYFAGFLIRARIKAGYDAEFVFQNTLCESYGKYIQIRTKDSIPYHAIYSRKYDRIVSDKNRAFYFKIPCLKYLITLE